MTPASAHKQGARYRYYVSAPLMQGPREEAGSVPRVPAPQIEQAVLAALRDRMVASGAEQRNEACDPREREQDALTSAYTMWHDGTDPPLSGAYGVS